MRVSGKVLTSRQALAIALGWRGHCKLLQRLINIHHGQPQANLPLEHMLVPSRDASPLQVGERGPQPVDLFRRGDALLLHDVEHKLSAALAHSNRIRAEGGAGQPVVDVAARIDALVAALPPGPEAFGCPTRRHPGPRIRCVRRSDLSSLPKETFLAFLALGLE